MKIMVLNSTKNYALDTNILIAMAQDNLEQNRILERLFGFFRQNKIKPFIPDKCLYEYFSVLSNLNKLKQTDIDVYKNFDYFVDDINFIILRQTDYTHYLVRDLLHKKGVSGKYIHDIVVIATLLENQIDCIITQNKKDFEGILGLEVMSLDDIALG